MNMDSNELTQATDPLFVSLKGKGQIQNAADCHVFRMTDFDQLERLIFMGNGQGDQMLKIIKGLMDGLLNSGQGQEVIERIRLISIDRRCVQQDILLYAYAICCRHTDMRVKSMAYGYLNKICRIPPDLFKFVKYCDQNMSEQGRPTGWGRAHRRAVSRWYTQFENDPERLLRLLTKYKRRGGVSNIDVIRLAHIKCDNIAIQFILRYIFRGFDAAENMLTGANEQALGRTFELMKAIEEAKNTLDESRLCHLIETYRLTWEQCPTWLLKKRTVLMSLLKDMPIEALVRKLGLMTSHQVFDGPNGEGTLKNVVTRLDSINTETERNIEGEWDDGQGGTGIKFHPMKLYKAKKIYMKNRAYGQEQCEQRSTLWEPQQCIVDALERAFYRSFSKVRPSGKQIYIALALSNGNDLLRLGACSFTKEEIVAVMMLTIVKTEETCPPIIKAVGEDSVKALDVNRDDDMDSMRKKLNGLYMPGKADWCRPFIDAIETRTNNIDIFLFFADCENAFSSHHVVEALQKYRQYSTNLAVKLIVCGLNASPHSLADNDDVHMLNISAFDSSVPELIAAFVRDEMHAQILERQPRQGERAGEIPDEMSVELPEGTIGMPEESHPDMFSGVPVELYGGHSAGNPAGTSEAMTDEDPGEMRVESSGTGSLEVNLNQREKNK